MNYVALNTELTTDPLSLGYAAPLAAQDWNGCAVLINALTGAGAATVTLPTMSNASFVTALLPYLGNLSGLSAPKQAFYAMIWQTILAMGTIDCTAAAVTGMLTQAVADNVLTQGQATAINQRTGSRAEVLFGVGTVVQWQDVSRAMLGA